MHYQTKLTAATQRIADLEEAVEGKQLALDRMVLEMQLSDSSPHEVKRFCVLLRDSLLFCHKTHRPGCCVARVAFVLR